MESMQYLRHRYLGGIKHFWKAVSVWQTEPCSGRPCTSKIDENVTKVRALVRSDQCLIVRMIGSELNLNHQTIHDILTKELSMRKICAKLVPKTLTKKQKEN